MPFDAPPPSRKVGGTGRQREDGVQMIGKDDDRVQTVRPLAAREPKSRPEIRDMIDQGCRSAIRQRDGEEERPSCQAISSIVNHRGDPALSRISLRSCGLPTARSHRPASAREVWWLASAGNP